MDLQECTPTLWVRSDLIPVSSAKPFPPNALQVETKVFCLPANWHFTYQVPYWLNRIEHAATALFRKAERTRASGFICIWWLPSEAPSQSGNRLEVKLFVSIAVRNPCRSQKIPEFKSTQEAEDWAWSNTWSELTDDTAVRLLLNLELGQNIMSYSSEYEGVWDDLQERLEREDCHILRFDSFGEIGDHVTNWRTQKRHALAAVIADTALLPAWHPLTWLPALEALIDASAQQDDASAQQDDASAQQDGKPLAWHAFRLGEDLGKLWAFSLMRRDARHFGWAAAQARFARTWCDFFASKQDAPKLCTRISPDQLRWEFPDLDSAFEFASYCIAEKGDLARYCFSLGYHVGSRENNVEFLVNQRNKLRKNGIYLPSKLEAKVDALEKLHSRFSNRSSHP